MPYVVPACGHNGRYLTKSMVSYPFNAVTVICSGNSVPGKMIS